MKWLRRWSAPALFMSFSLAAFMPCRPTPAAAPDDAKPPAEDKWLIDRSLTLAPQAEPRPAFEYRLFPLASERKDGNAVPIYLRLNFERNDAERRDWTETPKKWNAMPIDKIPLAEAGDFLNRYKNFLRQFELGSRRKTAEWNYTLDEGDLISILLPDAQMMRGYVPMMVLKVRVALAQGDYAAAAHWLETGFAFSRHVGNGPFLINYLVGVACANEFASCLLDFVERPDAPDLYWSLTALPRPLMDMRDATELEYRFLELQFPDLGDVDKPRAPEQWDMVLKKVRSQYRLIVGLGGESGVPSSKQAAGEGPDEPAAQSPDLAAARKYLVEHDKLTADKVAAMPAAQALVLYLVGTYHAFRDDSFKAAYLPFPESRRVFAEAEARRRAAPDSEGKRFADALLPAIEKVRAAQVRLERKIAALRVIEALRLHAAHEGALPDKLTAVTIVPMPDDPGTGKPFEYQRDGDAATLISRVPGEELEKTGLRFRLVMKKK